MRIDWTDLPTSVRDEIEAATGQISRIEPAATGNHAAIASTIHTPDGLTFVKAARKLEDRDGPEVMSLRRETAVNPFVTEFAPRLLWTVEVGEWLCLGFEHVRGRRADFSPGSADLQVLAKTIHALQATPCPDVVRMRVENRWKSVGPDVTTLGGDALLHTDLNEDNFLITDDGRAYLVDWAFVARGAAFVELGLLVPWLLKAGHTPNEAETFVMGFAAWEDAPSQDVDLFSRVFAGKWAEHARRDSPEDWVLLHARLTKAWGDYYLGRVP